jgi:hypothetical protein
MSLHSIQIVIMMNTNLNHKLFKLVRTRIEIILVAVLAMLAIIVITAVFSQLPFSHPLSNPIYIGLIIPALIISSTWWIHTKLKTS